MKEIIAEAIHNNWQGTGRGPAHRTWAETNETHSGQANSFRKYAECALESIREPSPHAIAKAADALDISPTLAYAVWVTMIDFMLGENNERT